MATIAEDLLILLTGEDGRHGLSLPDVTMSGALLSELAGRERIDLGDGGRLRVLDDTRVDEPLLDEALERFVGQAGRKPKGAIQRAAKGLAEETYQSLARAERVEPLEQGVLGITLRRAWRPVTEAAGTATGAPGPDAIRAELHEVLSGRQEADLRTGTLLALLRATGTLGRAFPREQRGGLSMNEIRRTAKEVAEGRWGSQAVRQAVQEMNAAVTTATTLPR